MTPIDSVLHELQAVSQLAKGQNINNAPETGEGFVDLLHQAVDKVNAAQTKANGLQEAFEVGQNVELHDVMIALQKASLSFQAMTQVRNKLVNAYQEVMNMQV